MGHIVVLFKSWVYVHIIIYKFMLVFHGSGSMTIKVNYLTNLCVGSTIIITEMCLSVNSFKL